MNVILDGCGFGRRKTGNETYLRSLLAALLALETDIDFDVITTAHYEGLRNPAARWHDIPLGNFFSRNFVAIPGFLKKLRRTDSLYHATYWTRFWSMPVPTVVTIHDISFASFPHGYKAHERFVYDAIIPGAAKRAAQIITVSEYSKRDICERWKIPEDRVTVTYEAVDDSFCPAAPDVAPEAEPYILYVGNLHPRKNLVRLLEAFVRLKQETRSGIRLKVVGQKAWLYQEIFETVRKFGLEKAVEFTGYIPQEELIRCYQQALFSIYPSLFEGFGFPVLESMACGCPVITSNTTSLPEVAGEAALLIDPTSIDEMVVAMNRLLTDAALRDSLRTKGLAQAASFSWQKAARETVEVYRRAL